MNILRLSGSPHIATPQSTRRIMWDVVFALLPALGVAYWYFGLNVLYLSLISVAACVLFEFLIQKIFLRGPLTITDGSAVITGLLLAFNVPSNLPYWMMIVGAFVAIGIAKMTFGGLGKNPFNPAIAGRIFLLISFPVEMTRWPMPFHHVPLADAITGPTALGILKEGSAPVTQLMEKMPTYTEMAIGHIGGSLGEVSAVALLLGAAYLLIRKVISWHIPFAFLITVAAFTGILWWNNPAANADPLFHLLAGGLILGAFFMATDPSSSPMNAKGKLLFGLGCGIITVVIRVWGSYPEGVSFAILMMNAVVPLINKAFTPKRFGEVVNHG